MECKQKTRLSGTETTADGLIFQRFFPVGKVYGPDVLVSAVADETVDLHLIFTIIHPPYFSIVLSLFSVIFFLGCPRFLLGSTSIWGRSPSFPSSSSWEGVMRTSLHFSPGSLIFLARLRLRWAPRCWQVSPQIFMKTVRRPGNVPFPSRNGSSRTKPVIIPRSNTGKDMNNSIAP